MIHIKRQKYNLNLQSDTESLDNDIVSVLINFNNIQFYFV